MVNTLLYDDLLDLSSIKRCDINWENVSSNMKLTKEIFMKYEDLLVIDSLIKNPTMNFNWCFGTDFIDDEYNQQEIIKNVDLCIWQMTRLMVSQRNINLICQYQKLSPRYLNDNMDKLNWEICSRYQDLSEDCIKTLLSRRLNGLNKKIVSNILIFQDISLYLLGWIFNTLDTEYYNAHEITTAFLYQEYKLDDVILFIENNIKNFAKLSFSEKVKLIFTLIRKYGNEAECVINLFPELME